MVPADPDVTLVSKETIFPKVAGMVTTSGVTSVVNHRYLVHRETILWYIEVEGMTRAIINPLPKFLNPEILPESFHIFACPVDI